MTNMLSHKMLVKAADWTLMLTLGSLIVAIAVTFGFGADVVLGKTHTQTALVDYAFVRVEGRPHNRTLAIKAYGLSCKQGTENFCDVETHGDAVIAKNVQFMLVNNQYSILKYGEFISKKGNFIVDNSQDVDLIAAQSIEARRGFLFLLLGISAFFLFVFLILKTWANKLKSHNANTNLD